MTAIGAMFEKEKKEAVMLTKAEDLVKSVDQIVVNGSLSLEEACRLLGVNVTAYEIAKVYIQEHKEKEEAVAV